MPSCWIEINLGAIENNFRAIQGLVGPDVQIIAVLKANAYGHGAVEVARTLAAAGAKYLAVTRLEEAIPLRAAGIDTPILMLAPALPDEVKELIPYRLTACISSWEDAELLSDAAEGQGTVARAQLKIDTGMGRFGVMPEAAIGIAQQIASLPGIELEAAWTHFAHAAGDVRDTTLVHRQFSLFQPLVRKLSHAVGISPNSFHCANSAALLRFPSMRLSCVRAGTVLYGQMPSPLAAEAAIQHRLKLENTFQAKARVLSVKTIRRGQSVGYGGEWTAPRISKIATVGIGFADGLALEPQTRSDAPPVALRKNARQAALEVARMAKIKGAPPMRTATIRNQHALLVGRIAMQSCALDVTDIEGVQAGDEVLVAMRRTSAGAHLPRVYRAPA
jgi:alanine racemase